MVYALEYGISVEGCPYETANDCEGWEYGDNADSSTDDE